MWGHVRGEPLDVNQLVHLVGWGDYQIEKMEEVAEHCPFSARKMKEEEEMVEKKVRFYVRNSKREFHCMDNFLTLACDRTCCRKLIYARGCNRLAQWAKTYKFGDIEQLIKNMVWHPVLV